MFFHNIRFRKCMKTNVISKCMKTNVNWQMYEHKYLSIRMRIYRSMHLEKIMLWVPMRHVTHPLGEFSILCRPFYLITFTYCRNIIRNTFCPICSYLIIIQLYQTWLMIPFTSGLSSSCHPNNDVREEYVLNIFFDSWK